MNPKTIIMHFVARILLKSPTHLIHCYDTQSHIFWSLFIFARTQHGNLRQSVVATSSVIYFILRVHTENCVSPN